MIPINVDGAIKQVQTKVSDAGFVDKDALGLFAVNYSENNTVPGTLFAEGNQADNVNQSKSRSRIVVFLVLNKQQPIKIYI